MEDNKRSIPCLVDGFKPSQRKVLFSCFKRNLKKEIKVCTYAEKSIIRDVTNQNTNASTCVRLLDSLNIYIYQKQGAACRRFPCGGVSFFFVWCGFVWFMGAFFFVQRQRRHCALGRLACC